MVATAEGSWSVGVGFILPDLTDFPDQAVKERVVAKRGASQVEKQPTSETARLEARIESARNELAVAIDQIAERVAPANVAAEAKSKARGIVINSDGSLRKDRAIKIAAVAGIVLAIGAWRRYR